MACLLKSQITKSSKKGVCSLNIFKNYQDLVRAIKILESNIELIDIEIRDWWFSISDEGIETGRLFESTPLDTSTEKYQALELKKENLAKKVSELKRIKNDIDNYIHSFEGIEFKVMYARYIEGKSLKDIATETGYTYQYIKELSSKCRNLLLSYWQLDLCVI